ncbi:ABC transporter ATP-binding protein [Faecalicatena contorta]|uniref:ABC transporter ATP-binding protein n=1 Tax=Faecalicatena fissicatena TaxID=290055 RepID=A0ABS2E6C9_9FIRM|nr:ABC transporter ATP-binding protein [Faecalicatena contorta]MBM6685942.1 ABC transporter ATP-binding protein [Faecalicatena contorta]MBM6711412.1 ABC transporter ATP-binding protein [Faecalicatena contorta]MBM6737175.1 ABC transporter ATP-binding protein [Faecalicatena fissicatena]
MLAGVKHYIQRIKEGRLKELTAELLWMYAYVRRYWLLIGCYILLGASGSVLSLGTSVVSKDLVDAITGVNSLEIVRVAGTYVGVGVSQIFINAVKSRLSLKVRLKVTNEIRGDIYEQVLRTNWESLAKYRSGDLLYRVNGDAGMVANTILTFLPNVVTTVISFGGAFIIVVQHDPWMALIALMGAPVSFLTSRYSARKMRQFQRDNQNVASDRTVFDQETFQNLQFIKAFGMIDRVTEKFHKIQRESVDLALEQNRFQQSMTIATSLVGQAVGYACYGFAAFRLWQGEISYGTMTMFVSMAGSLRGSFSGILGLLPMVIRSGISAERIMEITSLPRDSMEDKEEADEIRQKGQESGVYVHMEDVSFAYEEEDWIYQDASFRAEPGEIVALIGPSGQGKTTTLNLLLGLYHPQKGGIRVGNPGGRELKASSSTRCLFSYIPQGNTLFSGTIADNMRMVKPEASDEEIRSALEAACAWEFVEKLENGMDTEVRERGTRFSEGQKQRLSIARALLADAPVMILDEATSALDVATERRVLRQIIKKEPDRTVIVAAHRPSVFSMCSRVYEVGGQRLEEVDEEGIRRFLEEF